MPSFSRRFPVCGLSAALAAAVLAGNAPAHAREDQLAQNQLAQNQLAQVQLAEQMAEGDLLSQLLERSHRPQSLIQEEAPAEPVLRQQRGQDFQERPGLEEVPPASPAGGVDVTGVWYHLNHNAPERARAELERLQAAAPGWQPPPAVVYAVHRALVRQVLAAGGTPADGELAVLRSGLHPCEDPALAWLLAERGMMPAGTLKEMISSCEDPGIAAGSLDRLLSALPEAARERRLRQLREEMAWSPSATALLENAILSQELMSLGRLDAARARAIPPERLASLEAAVSRRGDGNSALALGWLYLNRGDSRQAATWFERGRSMGGGSLSRQLSADAARGMAQVWALRAIEAARAGDLAASLQAVHHSMLLGRQDVATEVGWELFNNGHPAEAGAFFALDNSSNALLGRALSLRAGGDSAAALALACDGPQRLDPACGDLLAEAMVTASREGRHADVVALEARLRLVSGPRQDVQSLLAWALLRSGDAAGAATLFAQLLDNLPETGAGNGPEDGAEKGQVQEQGLASGLVESLRRQAGDGQRAALAAAARRYPAVARLLAGEGRGTAFARKQFDLAARLEQQDAASPLQGRQAWSVGSGYEIHQTRGTSGQGRMSMMVPRVMAEGMAGEVRLGVELAGARLDSGNPAAATDLGHRLLAADRVSALSQQDVILPTVRARWEQPDFTVSGSLSSTPLSGTVAARPTGQLAGTWWSPGGDEALSLSGRLFSQPLTSSQLSFAGTLDPVTGNDEGGVVDSGAALQAIRELGGGFSLALGGEAAVQDGEGVADNSRYGLRADLPWSVPVSPAMDYLRVGPFVSWASWERNLGHYTSGHGGYYSPQEDARGGLLLDALTAEGQQWQLRTTASLGYGEATEAEAPRFPLQGSSGGTYAAATSRGLSGDLMVQGAALVAPQLMVGGFAGVSSASGYDSVLAGLTLRIPLQPRTAVVSTDLPVSALQVVR